MSPKQDANAVIVDELVALADKTAHTIARLQQEIHQREDRIAELEKARIELEKDAYWCRWFRRQYGNTPLISAVDAAFKSAHADFARSIGAPPNTAGGMSRKP